MQMTDAYLIEESQGWRLVASRDPWETLWQGPLESLAGDWKNICQRNGVKITGLAIVAGSENFLFDSFSQDEVGGSVKSSTLRFRLEADLPLSAEEIACDFHFGPTSVKSSVVAALACEVAPWLPLTRHLNQVSCSLRMFSAKSLLILQSLVEQRAIAETCLAVLVIDGTYEIVVLRQNQVVGWRMSGDAQNASRDWKMLGQDFEQQVFLAMDAVGELTSFREFSGGEVPETDIIRVNQTTELIRLLTRLPSNRSQVWFDLSSDEQLNEKGHEQETLQRLRRTALFVGCCLLGVALAAYTRAVRVRTVVAAVKQQQRELVTKAFPEQKSSPAVMARLKSEHAKWKGLRSADKNPEMPVSALPALSQIVACIPQDLAMSLLELRIENSQVYLDVEVNEIQSVGILAEALQKSGLDVSPPTTTSVRDGRVRAQIRGTRVADEVS